FYQSLPRIVADYPDSRWMFLTLTVRNCAIEELGETLSRMNTAFQRLKGRKEFRPGQGWKRTTEGTRGRDGSATPAFHPLLMVPPGVLNGKSYVRH
ncbi:protein rep, partial [Klebsiella pneumoniae]|nr:protein rep [Klebsiella pneumoniae]